MKGIVLTAGGGKRLQPMTWATSKQLLPIYDKPMIYYPLSVLLQAGIRDILLVTTKHDLENYKELLGDGSQFGVNISYVVQPSMDGVPQGIVLGKDFIGDDSVALVLGDNVFYGSGFKENLAHAVNNASKGIATIFGCRVDDPTRFGVVDFDAKGTAISIEEKPLVPKSNYAVTGLYFFDNSVVERACNLQPSALGHFEITDICQQYLDQKKLKVEQLDLSFAWFDTGTVDSLFNAGEFIRVMQSSTGVKVAALEEIAYDAGWIKRAQLLKCAERLKKTEYGKYLENIALSTRR